MAIRNIPAFPEATHYIWAGSNDHVATHREDSEWEIPDEKEGSDDVTTNSDGSGHRVRFRQGDELPEQVARKCWPALADMLVAVDGHGSEVWSYSDNPAVSDALAKWRQNRTRSSGD